MAMRAGGGGTWLTGAADPASILTPERLSDEHRMIRRTAEGFIDQEVLPVLGRLERKDWNLARALIRRCGDLGLLGTDVPESLGGLQLDRASALIVGESVGRCPSFGTAFGAQTGLAVTPLLLFGSEEQKKRYVPRLVAGDIIGAYALSEAGAGSDALSGRTRALRQPDGSFLLSGEKMWITNGGFADAFVVFAKVQDWPGGGAATGSFTAFIVERTCPGVSCGEEEHKMGLHGSSTTPVILQDARVPSENVLGAVGEGHTVAFSVLNYGRMKLGAMCTGGARAAIADAAAYAAERRQFGRPIASFGAIREKLGDMVSRTYAVEAMLYRTAGLMDAAHGADYDGEAAVAALRDFAVEASILKVAGSEMLDFVVDENVQIHGGNGFVRDYAAEGRYRDARVNRIFEGTNEINRLLIAGLLAKRVRRGALSIPEPAGVPPDARLAPPSTDAVGSVALGDAAWTVAAMKSTAATMLAAALRNYPTTLEEEQEIMSRTADAVIGVYGAESAVVRASAAGTPLHAAAARVFVNDAAGRVETAAREAFAAMGEANALGALESGLHGRLAGKPVDTVALRRQLADAVAERRVYPF